MAKNELRQVGGTFNDLEPVLNGWCDLQAKYAAIEGEPCYDNSEVANTSLVVSAANGLRGWTGISEYWMERRPKPVCESNASQALGRGLIDAYIGTDEKSFFLELKQSWMVPNSKKPLGFSIAGANPFAQAQKQIQQLNYAESDARESYARACYGAFFIPTIDTSKNEMKRKAIFAWLVDYCRRNTDSYAVFSPALSKKKATRGGQNRYRPMVALGLKVHSFVRIPKS